MLGCQSSQLWRLCVPSDISTSCPRSVRSSIWGWRPPNHCLEQHVLLSMSMTTYKTNNIKHDYSKHDFVELETSMIVYEFDWNILGLRASHWAHQHHFQCSRHLEECPVLCKANCGTPISPILRDHCETNIQAVLVESSSSNISWH